MKYRRVEGFVVEAEPRKPGREIQFCKSEHEKRLAEMIRGLNDQEALIVIRALKQKYGTEATL